MPLRPANCPHCFREVYVNTDALCPACRGNVDDTIPEHEGLTPVDFVDGEALPPICVVCARPANSEIEVGEQSQNEKPDWVERLSRFVGAAGGLLSIRIDSDPPHPKEFKISVKLPVCESHRTARSLQPIYVDRRSYRLTVPVHREFIKHWKKVPEVA